ncbi:RHS repeat-associated core domain-containing protein [Tenacibaculum sp. TC6]|uniref:RHS repeat-associated core domain-containing protein n=1 Tax=Tenacibaculum sp. TC6 TaxID=3423223 RepID=UPI003D36A808
MRQLGVAATSTTDYYPFGMPMPNRRTVNGEPYRYAYQGQEKDPETGKEAFQLRLWDARIGRWLSPDPYHQYPSPYLGMGNNPTVMTDPDGGFTCYMDGKVVPCNDLSKFLGHSALESIFFNATYGSDFADYHQTTLQEVTINGSNGGYLNFKNILYEQNQDFQNKITNAQEKAGLEFLSYLSVINPWTFAGMIPAASVATYDASLVTLYRGVNSSAGKAYKDALKGVVKPRGGRFGHTDVVKHNTGLNGTVESAMTSWTTNKDVALNYAYRGASKDGVLLKLKVPSSKIIKSVNRKSVNLIHKPGTVVSESEKLLKGSIKTFDFKKVKF